MVEPLAEDQLTAIDASIFANKIIQALKLIRDASGISLNDALVVFYERYALLRAKAPERFERPNREYWRDFYTDGPQPPMAEPGTLPDLADL